jgi:hypothetical protein
MMSGEESVEMVQEEWYWEVTINERYTFYGKDLDSTVAEALAVYLRIEPPKKPEADIPIGLDIDIDIRKIYKKEILDI